MGWSETNRFVPESQRYTAVINGSVEILHSGNTLVSIKTSHRGQLSLAIPLWVGAMSECVVTAKEVNGKLLCSSRPCA